MSLILPNLLFLGPPKCGTTTFYSICETHPDICVSSFKEPAFFSDEKAIQKGLKWYSNKYFSHCNGKKVVCEFTPAYFSSSIAIKNIHSSFGPDTKFAVVLRNPAHRSYSHYLHLKREGLVSAPFDVLMYQLADNYSKNNDLNDRIGKIYTDSLYDVHFANFFKYFPDRSNLLILSFEEDVRNNCLGFKTKLSDFMNLEFKNFPDGDVEIKNSAQELNSFIMPFMRFLNSDNFLKKISRKIVPAHVRFETGVKINVFVNKNFIKPSVKPDAGTLTLITTELFSESIRNTEKIINEKLIYS